MDKTVISIIGTEVSVTPEEGMLTSISSESSLRLWQKWTVNAAKGVTVYCAISILVLFLITVLILTGTIFEIEIAHESTEVPHPTMFLKHSHRHTMEFYTFVMTVLVSIRAGLYYMAKALERASNEKDLRAIGIWLIISFIILFIESLLAVALFNCLPGILSIVLVFILVELLTQATLIWIVWNLKLELSYSKSEQLCAQEILRN